MTAILGLDQFSLNGIPSDIDAMFKAFPFGWYQISNGMTVGIMTRKAWPVYGKHYGGYHYFNPNPDGNWIFQSWIDYAESCAMLFLDSMKGNFGGTPPMIDVEARISQNYLQILFPKLSPSQQTQQGNILYFQMLKKILEIVETETGKTPVLYTGNNFWLSINGQNQSWASHYPLMIAIYPFDNFTKEAEYLAAIQKIMDGTNTLSSIQIPPPWTAATYIQFTGRGPASLVPGYTVEPNWAKTVDINIQVAKETIPTPMNTETHGVPDAGPAKEPLMPVAPSIIKNLFSSTHLLNVRSGADKNSELLGNLPPGSTIAIDKQKGEYSHFTPLPQYPVGGWVFSSFLVKVTSP